MKKHAKTIKRFVAMALSVVMVISLFPNGALRAFAEELAKYSHITPVVSTTFAEDEVTLYKDVESKEETKVSGVSGIEIELHKKVTVDDEVYYQYYYVGGGASEELQATMSEYMVVSAEDVAYTEPEPTPEPTVEPTPEPTVEPTTSPSQGGMLGTSLVESPATIADEEETSPETPELMYREMTDGATGIQVNATVPTTATLHVSSYSAPEPSIENGLIWGRDTSVFYNVSIKYNDQEYIPEGGAEIVFPTTAIPFANGSEYVEYTFTSLDSIDSRYAESNVYDIQKGISMPFPGYGVAGVTQRAVVTEGTADVGSVVALGDTLTFYDFVYADFVYQVDVPVTEEDVLTVYSKDTISLGSFSVDVYWVDYTGENEDILDAISNEYMYVLCSDVEEYSPVIPTTPQTLTDKNGTGITVSGDLPEGVTLEVTEIPSDQVGLIVDTDMFPLGTTTKAYDIKLVMPDGSEYDPNGYVKIKITKDNLEIDGGTGLVVYSNHDDQTDIIGPVIYSGNNFNLSVENTGEFVFTDLFKEAGFEEIEGKFNKETVTLYCDLFPGSPVFEVTDATKKAVTSSMYLVDQNNVKWRMLNEDFVDADGEYYVWAKDADITQCELLPEQTLVDETTGIKVEGRLPEGVELNVTPLERGDVDIDEEKYPLNADMFLYDITLTLDGEKYQPEDSVSIIFPEGICTFENGLFYVVYHVHDDGTVDVLGPYGYITGDIRITVDSFSSFGFSEDYSFEEITPFQAVFTGTTVKLYREHVSEEDYIEVEVTDKDIVTPYMKITLDDGTEKYALDYYTVAEDDENYNSALAAVLNGNPAYNIVKAEDIKEYIPLVDQDVSDPATGITVSGALPQGTGVVVKEKSIPADWDTSKYPLGNTTKVFDISLSFRGEEYQPEGYVTIDIPENTLAMGDDKGLAIYHVHNGETDIIGPVVYGGKDFSLSIDNFSDFVFTDAFGEGYTTGWRGFLNKDEVEVFENIFPDSASFVKTDAIDYAVRGDIYFTAEDGSMWFMLEDGIDDENGEKYIFVKSEDVRLTYLDDVCVAMPSENFTQVAQPRLISALSAAEPQMAAVFGGRALLANSNARASAVDPGTLENGLFTSKNVSGPDSNGVYTITLEAYVTGTVTVTRSSIPTDIVLVLDQSGSMDKKMGEYVETDLGGALARSYYNHNNPIYVKDGNNKYPVTVTRSEPITGEPTYTEYSGNSYNENDEIYNRRSNLYVQVDGVYYKAYVTRNWNNNTRVYSYTYYDEDGNPLDTITSNRDGGTPPWTFYYRTEGTTTYTYTYTYTDGSGVVQQETFGYSETLPAEKYYTSSYNSDAGEVRLTALKKAVQTFVENVADDASGEDNTFGTADDINHRIAVVGFANYSNNDNFNNTELFVGSRSYTYNAGAQNNPNNTNAAQQHYADAMQDMNTQDGLDTVRATVGYDANKDGDWNDTRDGDINGVLDGDGATYIDLGIELANGILEKEAEDTTYKNGDTVVRQKVVIVFTDGVPGYSGNWGGYNYNADYSGNNAGAVADAAVDEARITKNTHGATVYTIGIFGGANADNFSISGNSVTLDYKEYVYNDNTQSDDNANRYMHYLSSNYTPASTATSASMTSPGTETFPRTSGVPNGDSFYLSAADSDALNNIFQKLSENISGSTSSTLEEETVVKDIVSPYFKLPDGADKDDIIVKTFKATGYDSTNGYSWVDEGALAGATIDVEGKTIDVSGFNFKANYVASTARKETESSETANFYGRKLYIEIPIVVNPDFLGGLNVPTNDEDSGIYENSSATEPVRAFNIPKVDVALKNIQPVLQDQHIYVSTSADLDKMLAGTDTDARYEYRIVNSNGTLSDVYDFDGINNEYVNVTYTVKDGSAVVKTLTIPADSNSGEWKFGDSVVNALVGGLTADKTYTITCQLTEKTDSSVKSTEKSDTGTVYVYKPEVTYKDSTYYYGIATPDPAANLTAGPVWKNPTQGTANTTTMGAAPTISFAYTPSETVDKHITGKLTPDGVDITFTVGATANGMNLVEKQAITFVHTPDTNITNCPFNAANGQFMWHIVKPTVQFADKGVHYGATLGAADTKTAYNNVTTSWIYKEGVTPTAVEGTQPTITFGYDNDLVTSGGTVNTTADITVPVTVYLDGTAAPAGAGIIKSSTCAIKGDSTEGGFKLHVYTPVVTFDDTGMYYDGTTITDFSKNLVSEEWLCGDIAEAAMITTKPTLSYTYTPASIAPTTDDVYVNVVAKANNTELAEGTTVTFKHMPCFENETFDAAKGEFIVHIFTPAVQFKDSNVYLGAAKPADASFAANTGEVTWANASNVTVADDNMLNSKPEPTFSYEIVDEATYITDGVITSVNDIPVKATVKVGEADITTATAITHEDPCTAISDCTYTQPSDGTSHFVLHVFAPVIPFQDTTVYYGDAADIDASICKDEVTWKRGTVEADPAKMTGTKPTTFRFDIVWDEDNFISTGGVKYVNTTSDIPFDVTEVLIGSSEVNFIDKVTLTHKDCEENEVMPDYSTGNKAEFVIHVETVDLEVSKTVKDPQGKDLADGKDYTFTVDFEGKVDLATIKQALNGATATDYTVSDNKITFELKHGDVIKFTELPVGRYEVTETDPGDAYETTVNGAAGLSDSVTLSKDITSGTMAFVNTLTIADLLITKNVPAASYNAEDTFVFDVDMGGSKITVVINSGIMVEKDGVYSASVKVNDINVGTEVKVTEDTSWSWRYQVTGDPIKTATITADGGSVTFENTNDNDKWLGSEAYAENIFDAIAN